MRGTSDILYSCLLTLFACVYTALHLNVPKRGSGFFSLLLTKLIWSLVALLAPEVVLYYSVGQFIEARRLAKYMNRLYQVQRATLTGVDSEKVPDSPIYVSLNSQHHVAKKHTDQKHRLCLT